MKLVTFKTQEGAARAGWLQDGGVVDMQQVSSGALPADMLSFIDKHEEYFQLIEENNWQAAAPTHALADVQLLAPLPNPRSFRDYISFEQHLKNASSKFGHQIAAEWYEMPIFYFTNHQAIYGPGQDVPRPQGETRLDYELEMGCVIGKRGQNIKADEADAHIFGYTIFNDFTARAIQAREMRCNLGPAKGKDFANSIGPYLVTKDEMQPLLNGDGRFNARMTSRINGQTICDGNFNTIHYTFGQMIERASENHVNLYPGDIIGSGTVGWGSLIETNFEAHSALVPGDVIELEIDGLGVLRNQII
ncbi:fumarylacetoacetate hydrolase family protein [Hymenobacter sp. BT491]|uniref:fumarylacetoacetate hydrolase family protein n=1 Tax=Hymenobacter sp. BT491 TaxID=2766779 RepID=UPI001653B605|nr:fumarylacetoacetate hydrolase family protein [Hymenobacter sp. BT491]MBC6992001.1 fumarylacetoacetate hydrolase family protein [Hymenobacter sp. BT491]